MQSRDNRGLPNLSLLLIDDDTEFASLIGEFF